MTAARSISLLLAAAALADGLASLGQETPAPIAPIEQSAPTPSTPPVSQPPAAGAAPSPVLAPVPKLPALARAPILVSHDAGHFDALLFDPDMGRVMAAHPGNARLAVYNVPNRIAREYVTGEVTGVAVDVEDDKVFVAGDNQKVVILDRKSLVKVDQIVLDGHAAQIVYDPEGHRLYVDHDGKPDMWVIDGRTHVVIGSVKLDGIPGFVAYDSITKRIYQSIRDSNRIDVVDPLNDRVSAAWLTTPAANPRGIAVDSAMHRLFVAGANGQLVVVDTRSGAVISAAPIADHAEQIAYDERSQQVFCASGTDGGTVSVVQITRDGQAATIGEFATQPGAQALALARRPDATDVWTAYTAPGGSYLQCYSLAR